MTHPKRPWWQATTTPKWGFIGAGLWAVIAAAQWWRLASDLREGSSTALTVALPVLSTLLAIAYLASTLKLRQRLRGARTDRDADLPPR